MIKKVPFLLPVLIVILSLSSSAFAQDLEKKRKTLSYLQSEPATLFDQGMKRLRSAALNTAARLIDKSNIHITSSVSYKHEEGNIEIQFNLKDKVAGNPENLHKNCLQSRKNLIFKMFSIGPTEFSSQTPVNERISRRIGVQFAHEPVESSQSVLSMARQLETLTYVTVNLAADDPSFNVTCRGLAVDLLGV